MKTYTHIATAAMLAFILLGMASCKEHKEAVSPPVKEDIGMNGFIDASQSTPGGGGSSFDSSTIRMVASSFEYFGNNNHIYEAAGWFSPAPDSVLSRNIGQVTISSALVNATEEFNSDSSRFVYRLRGRHNTLQVPYRPVFGQLTNWKISSNTYGIPPLDTTLYTLAPLNVFMSGHQVVYESDRVATTGTLSLSWTPDANADIMQVEVTYWGKDPRNTIRNMPDDWRAFYAVLPGSASGIDIPPAVLGKLPAKGALFKVLVRRQKIYYFPHGGMYAFIRSSNVSSGELHTL